MEARRGSAWRKPATLLMAVLIVSGVVAGWLVYREIRSGGVEEKWDYKADYGAYWIAPRFFDKDGSLIVEEAGSPDGHLLSFSPNGELKWKSTMNGWALPEQGPDGKFYYVNYPDQSLWLYNNSLAWPRNLTCLDTDGSFSWDYVVDNGTLEIWGIYPDGEVILYLNYDPYGTPLDRIIGVRGGNELWSMYMPVANCTWHNSRVGANGTFTVNAYAKANYTGYEVGVSSEGSVVYVEKDVYFRTFYISPNGRNETVEFEECMEFIDDETSIVYIQATSLINGTTLWKTELLQSDNPDHVLAGVSSVRGTLLDSTGTIYCDGFGERSFALDLEGRILWEKPFYGWMVGTFPSGGVLVWDEVSLKRIGQDGGQVWRHYASHDGYSTAVIGSDETIYYGGENSIIALAHTSGMTLNMVLLIVVASVDVVAVLMYVRARRQERKATPDLRPEDTERAGDGI